MTNTIGSIQKGNKMKKTMFVAALAAVMIFALAAPAFASWGGWAGNGPYTSTPGENRPSSSYILWDDVATEGNVGDLGTPHAGYTNSSTLCAVCHSVHYAPVFEGQIATSTVSGAWEAPSTATTNTVDYFASVPPGTYPAQAELLLRSNAGTACNYCHVDSSIGNIVVYAGQSDIFGYSQNFTSSYAHDFHNGGCGDCHSVHGGDSYAGPLASKILHERPRNRDPQREVIADTPDSNTDVPALYATLADAYAGTDILGTNDRYIQQSAFCSSCHYVYTDGSDRAIKERGGGDGFTKHHPMTAAGSPAALRGAAKGANNTAAGKQWAWAGSNTCRSCHSAGFDGGNTPGGTDKTLTAYSDSSFPHYTKDKYRFLDQASTAEYATDEVCLDCHRNGDGTAGVGVSY